MNRQADPTDPVPTCPRQDEVQPATGEACSQMRFTIAPLIDNAMTAFRRELPRLLKDRYRQWVAYSGDRQIGFSSSKTQLYQDCLRSGLKPGEFIVQSIESETPREADVSPDV